MKPTVLYRIDSPLRLRVDYSNLTLSECARLILGYEELLASAWRSAVYEQYAGLRFGRASLLMDSVHAGNSIEVRTVLAVTSEVAGLGSLGFLLLRHAMRKIASEFAGLRAHRNIATHFEIAEPPETEPPAAFREASPRSLDAGSPAGVGRPRRPRRDPDQMTAARAEKFARLAAEYEVKLTISSADGFAFEVDGRR